MDLSNYSNLALLTAYAGLTHQMHAGDTDARDKRNIVEEEILERMG